MLIPGPLSVMTRPSMARQRRAPMVVILPRGWDNNWGRRGGAGLRDLRGNPGASVNEPLGCAGIRDRRYRQSRILVTRSPSCHVLRGNRGASVPTVGDSGAALPALYRRSAILAQRDTGFTDGAGFSRSRLPAVLPCVTNVCLLSSLLEDERLPVV